MIRATLLDSHFRGDVWVVLMSQEDNERPVIYARNVPGELLDVYLGAYPEIEIEDKRTGRKPSADKPESYSTTGELRRGGFSVI